MSNETEASVRASIEEAIAAHRPVVLVVRLESGRTHEIAGTVTGIYKAHDGRERVALLVGLQTQQAVPLDTIADVKAG